MGFQPGDRVSHRRFGDGVVLEATQRYGERDLVVQFNRHGTKRLVESLADLKGLDKTPEDVSSKPIPLWVSDTPVTVVCESINDTPDGRLSWNFIVSDPRSEYDGKRVRLLTTWSLAKGSRARRYVEILLNRACFPGEDIHEDSLIGQAAAVYQGDLIGEIHDEVDIRVMPYQSYLKTEHWQKVREAALERAEHRCQTCDTDEHLHVHHRTYERRGAERDSDVIVLCKPCHERFHGVTNGRVTHTVR